MVEHMVDTKRGGRVDIRTGVGRRRRWTAQEKGRIVAETLTQGAVVSQIAQRHEMSSQHLFNWIRAAKAGHLVLPEGPRRAADAVQFVPVVAVTPSAAPPSAAPEAACRSRTSNAAIEIEVDGMILRLRRGVDLCFLGDVLRTLRISK